MELGQQLLRDLTRWTKAGAIVWPRADFRCEYCSTDLVGDLGTYRWGTTYDHILPKKIYNQIRSEPETRQWYKHTATNYRNLALACHFCNSAKWYFDPGEGFLAHDITDISEPQRTDLLTIIRDHLGDRGKRDWEAARTEYRRFREIIGRS